MQERLIKGRGRQRNVGAQSDGTAMPTVLVSNQHQVVSMNQLHFADIAQQ